MSNNTEQPSGALDAVFVESVEMPEGSVLIQGPDFNKELTLSQLLGAYKQMGYQGSSLGESIEIIKEMVIYIVDDIDIIDINQRNRENGDFQMILLQKTKPKTSLTQKFANKRNVKSF